MAARGSAAYMVREVPCNTTLMYACSRKKEEEKRQGHDSMDDQVQGKNVQVSAYSNTKKPFPSGGHPIQGQMKQQVVPVIPALKIQKPVV